jgi:hypothetical protein
MKHYIKFNNSVIFEADANATNEVLLKLDGNNSVAYGFDISEGETAETLGSKDIADNAYTGVQIRANFGKGAFNSLESSPRVEIGDNNNIVHDFEILGGVENASNMEVTSGIYMKLGKSEIRVNTANKEVEFGYSNKHINTFKVVDPVVPSTAPSGAGPNNGPI